MKTTGILKYSPLINGKLPRQNNSWWLIIEADPELGKYYRKLYSFYTYKVYSLQRPAWETHISVIRGENPVNLEFWGKYEGETIEFDYSLDPQTNGIFFWFPVIKCDRAGEIRAELGLPLQPPLPLHMTIGNCKMTS